MRRRRLTRRRTRLRNGDADVADAAAGGGIADRIGEATAEAAVIRWEDPPDGASLLFDDRDRLRKR